MLLNLLTQFLDDLYGFHKYFFNNHVLPLNSGVVEVALYGILEAPVPKGSFSIANLTETCFLYHFMSVTTYNLPKFLALKGFSDNEKLN